MANRIQYRRDTAANWTAANPVLALGEPGWETDTKLRKIGDGATAWNALGYQAPDKATLDVSYNRPDTRAVKAGQLLYNADHLRRWRTKLADAQNAQCHVGVYGDSITWGAYSNNNAPNPDENIFRATGWVTQMRSLFASRYGAVGEGYFPVTSTTVFTVGGGTFLGGPSRAGLFGTRAFLNGTANTLTITLPASTTVDVMYFWPATGGAAFSYTVDGGTSTTAPTQSTSGVYRLRISGLANTTHTVVITGSASGSNEIVAAGAFTDTTKGVAVHRYGKSGQVLANHFSLADPGTSVSAADQQSQITGAVSGLNTDLAVIFLSANNATQYGPLTPAQHLTGLQAAANNIVGQGKSILLVGGPPVNPAGTLAGTTYHQSDYDANLKTVSNATDHVAFLDLGAYWKDWATANALGLYSDAIVHPTRAGHGDIANVVFDVLTRAY